MAIKRYTKEELDFLRMYSENFTIKELSLKFNRSSMGIGSQLRKLKISAKRSRMYYPNEEYFNNYTDKMFYLVGFFVADGCISHRRKEEKVFKITLGDKDKKHLYKIRDEISPDSSVFKRVRKRKNKITIEHELRICSRPICNSLENFGIFPRKTGYEQFQNIPRKYFYNYLLGLSDGDGSVGLYNRKNTNSKDYNWYITSSCYDFLNEIREYEGNNLGGIYKIDKKVYNWKIGKMSQIHFLYEKFYNQIDSSELFLQRKKDGFERILKYGNLLV